MSLRSTFVALALLLALCGGTLYAVNSYFSRDSQMRRAEQDFATDHRDEIEAARTALQQKRSAEPDAVWSDAGGDAQGEEIGTPDLSDWYADAGSGDEPFDPVPEDKSHLINDAQPYSEAEPFG